MKIKITKIPNNKKSFGGWSNTHGGDFSNEVTQINSGGLHSTNPFEGVQMGVDPNGIPNLVEEGEVIYNDYVFSNRMVVPEDFRKKYKIRGKTYAEAAKQKSKASSEMPNDPITKRGLDAFMSALSESQEEERIKEDMNNNKYAKGGKLGIRYDGPGSQSNYIEFDTLLPPINAEEEFGDKIDSPVTVNRSYRKRPTYMRYAPIVGSAIASIGDIFTKPDYTEADSILDIDLSPSLVSAAPISQKLSYTPFDRDFYINKLNSNSAATRRAVQNSYGNNRAAALTGILAADYNYGNQLGDLARQAEEYNQSLKERVSGFNRQTDMFNSQQSLQAQSTNAQSRNSMKNLRLSRAEAVARMKQAIKDQDYARRSTNITSLLQGLGDLGWENEQANWLDRLAKDGVLKLNTRGEYTGGTKAKGGKLKKKRRLTYA